MKSENIITPITRSASLADLELGPTGAGCLDEAMERGGEGEEEVEEKARVADGEIKMWPKRGQMVACGACLHDCFLSLFLNDIPLSLSLSLPTSFDASSLTCPGRCDCSAIYDQLLRWHFSDRLPDIRSVQAGY